LAHAGGVPSTDETSAPVRRTNAQRRSTALTLLTIIAVLFLLRYAQDVFIPLALAVLLFYALDPVVDWISKLRVPRIVGAAIVLLSLLMGVSWTVYSVRDEALQVVENMP
jgi:predicted PurR-regulated permease PerM